MEQIYKGYATFDAMTQTDFFFRTDLRRPDLRRRFP